MALSLAPLPVMAFLDNNGNPLVGGKLFTYQSGTSIKQATYTDSGGLTPNSNPIILNARGECNCWLTQNVTYKLVLAPTTDTDPPTNPIWSVDNVNQGISNITSDVNPAVDATYSLGALTLRWLNVLISGAFKIINSSFTMAIQLGQALTANRTVTIPDATILLGGSTVYFQRSNYSFTSKDAGATLVNDTASTYTYTIQSGVFMTGACIEIEQVILNGIINVAAGAGVTIYDYLTGTSVSSFPVVLGERVKIKNIGGDIWTVGFHVKTGSFVGTFTQMTTTITGTINYSLVGDRVQLWSTSNVFGTSNAIQMTMTGVPAILRPSSPRAVVCPKMVDNGNTELIATATIDSAGVVVFLLLFTNIVANEVSAATVANFTAAGTKGIQANWMMGYVR